MVRTTFGPTGKPIQVLDPDTQHDLGEARQATVIDDNTGADVNFRVLVDHSDGDASDETASDLGQTGSGTRTYTDPGTAQTRTRRKRGPNRPKTGTNTGTNSATSSAAFVTANLEKVLYNLHKMGAGLLAEPDLEITKDEAAILTEAMKEVMAAYDFTAMLNPRTQAWVDFGIACTAVYGERLMRVIKRPHAPKPVAVIQPRPAPQQRPYQPPQQPITVVEAYRESVE